MVSFIRFGDVIVAAERVVSIVRTGDVVELRMVKASVEYDPATESTEIHRFTGDQAKVVWDTFAEFADVDHFDGVLPNLPDDHYDLD